MTPEQLLRKYYALFNERRLDEAGELVAPNASFHYLPTRQHLVGRAGYRALAAGWLIAFEDAVASVESVETINPYTVRVQLTGRGTHTGALVFGDHLTIPPTGRRVELRAVHTTEVRNDQIVRVVFDFDLPQLQQQLAATEIAHAG